MKDLQANANEAYRKSAGASTPPSRPISLAASDKHVAAVAKITARRAQSLRNPKGIVYPTDAR